MNSGSEALGIRALQLQPESGTREVGRQLASDRNGRSVEEHLLYPNVVVKIFKMTNLLACTSECDVQGWCSMCRERQTVGDTELRRLQESRYPAATGCVSLEDINGPGVYHPPEVVGIVTVLSGRNVHPGGSAVANEMQALEIVRGNRL